MKSKEAILIICSQYWCFLTKHRHEGVLGRGGIAPRILDIGISGR